MKKKALKLLSVALALVMLLAILPAESLAAVIFNPGATTDDYYKLISKRDWNLAPGVDETEIVMNNAEGTKRQVLHTVTVDMNNPYTKVIPGYKGMIPTYGNYGTESTSTQALWAEEHGYGNVVAATNAMLSWYTGAYYEAHPDYVGEPLYYNILDGYYYENSQGKSTFVKSYAVLVINYDNHPVTGEPRPADMPKVLMRSQTDPLTGWEQNAICVWQWLVKPDANGVPVNQFSKTSTVHTSGKAARTFVGIKADGTIVMSVSDGEQAPYSEGFSMYEMADYMIKMGCVYAANCDGGGSTTFVSQRPGEELKVNGSLADGGERPTTNTILVISTAPADGVFARATIDADYDYYTPGSTVEFTALGTDAVGTKVDIPEDAVWTIQEDGMGTINNGVFVSNGTEGTVTAQLSYNGAVVGERSVTIATPTEISFSQPVMTVPFGKTAVVPIKATINNGVHQIGLSPNDITFTTTNPALGTFNGLSFTAVDEESAPADLTSNVTATLNMGTNPTASVQLKLGKGSVVLYDFEGGQPDVDVWNVINNRKNAAHWQADLALSLADRENGQVHDGNYSMRLETNTLHSKDSDSIQYAWFRLGTDGEALTLENAKRVGFWLYVPDENIHCWVMGHYMYDSDGNGTLDSLADVNLMTSEFVYRNVDESDWYYISMDVSEYSRIALKYSNQFDKDPSDGMSGEKGEFWLAIILHKAQNNMAWGTNGSIYHQYTYYIDNITVDYSDAVDDREKPLFDNIYLDGNPLVRKLGVNGNPPVVTTNNTLNLTANVADATTLPDSNNVPQPLYNVSGLNAASAKAFIDGIEVPASFDGSTMSVTGIKVADGYHRVKFEICDNAGNKAIIVRLVQVNSGVNASTLHLVPEDATLDRIPFGSIYWMNLNATNIETIQKVETVIDLNATNHWQLDHMELAEGFTAEYEIAEETNTATITFTRTGENDQTGEVTLARIPVRIISFDEDIHVPGYTAATYWTNYNYFAQDMKMDVDMGKITHIDGYQSNVLDTFSNEQFHVDTEMYNSFSYIDKLYHNEHGTTHVHTPEAIPDQAPTCIKDGYTGRTFCNVCNSVVEWGTTVPATGHNYAASGNQIVCSECGKVSKQTGIIQLGDYYYYAVNGTLQNGWVTVGDDWYYFDETTYHNVPTYNNGFVTYTFEEDGKLTHGEWYHCAAGIMYYYGPSYLRGGKSVMTWYEIDGNTYCIPKSGFVLTGLHWVNDVNGQEIYTWYNFDENGACQGRYYGNGLTECEGCLYYLRDGVSQYGMYLVDGEYYYFYFTNWYGARHGERFRCVYNNGLLPEGNYYFGDDCKMLNNDVYCVDETLYYFVMGKESQGPGTVELNGENWPIEADGKVLFTGFLEDANGKSTYYVDGVCTYLPKNGLYHDDDGEVRYYVDDVPTRAGLVMDTDGSYYYINSSCMAVKNCRYAFSEAMSNGLLPAGEYLFGPDGRMVDPPHVHEFDEGVITTAPTCTEEGVKTFTCECGFTKTETVPALGHIDENGDEICDRCGADLSVPHVHGWDEGVVTTEPTCTEAGVKTFTCVCGETRTEVIAALGHIDEDGDKVCDRCGQGMLKNGLYHDDDGEIRYYVDGQPTRAGLVMDIDGSYYYINSSCKAVKNCRYAFSAAMSNGLLPAGEYTFGPDGRMIDPPHVHNWGEGTVTTDATCTEDGVKTYTCECGAVKTEIIPALGHIDENEDEICDRCGTDLTVPHTHEWDDGVVTTPATCTTDGVKTFTCECGATRTEVIAALGHIDEDGDKVCDRCGQGMLKNGLYHDDDGEIRYYVDGQPTRAGLVRDTDGSYYYINSSCKAVRSCRYAFSTAMGNGLLPGGEYEFGADCRMIDPPVT